MDKALSTQRAVVAGLGMTGQACVRFLQGRCADLKAWDSREHLTVHASVSVPVTLGTPATEYFNNVDVLILSPGIDPQHPVVEMARSAGVTIMGDVELFAHFNTVPAIGITGSNGKTTVTLLTTHILSSAGQRVVAAGNVGRAVLDTLELPLDAIVLELSSFQLESTSSLRLQAGCLLNLSDDHLDRHRTMEAYLAAKQRLFMHCHQAAVWRGQDATRPSRQVDTVIEYGLDAAAQGFGVSGDWITCNGENVLDIRRIPLAGSHNVLNIQAAMALALSLGVSPAQAAEAVYRFEPAPHRCVDIATINGVRYIDDSKATNAGATLAAIEGLASSIQGRLFLIAGGDAKGADLSVLRQAITDHVEQVYAIGKDAPQFTDMTPQAQRADSLEHAVRQAAAEAKPGDIILLSPACASLDMFSNYIHRAEVFRDAVHALEVAC
ncbi:UDP-N-acetylmuramoyl-L-alanine--D-glutamate ligase [Alteromonas halophila]|uniref:UDP-N-acetylmuramoylalanine--D-glutamate ligase n=1 Tax=Alteromonas halophila TaxID=516698 RepID=A0A918JQT7_9ALTE|nr:UDP-N-acetylmuramoyl-L-alanine--D-glutamate ligase [Alteromonas halophila]GGW94230.1 UDP-N-acetylmuramoylalanine--D-glutamate ligase [Alteromonas halophila]